MDGAEKALTAISSVDTDLGQLRDKIDGVISTTTQTADGLRPSLEHIQRQIDKLGPPLIHTIRGVGYTLRPPADAGA